MKKILKNKKISTFFSLIILGAGFYFVYSNFFHNIKTAAAWYNDSWYYRQSATVTNNTGAQQTAHQLKITLNTSALISASQLQSVCQDLRFTNTSGKELPYWIESGCNTTTTKIWVKADAVPQGSSTIYVYYGNPTAAAGSNGEKTFELFDDFLSPNINYSKWDVVVKGTGGTIGVSGTGEAVLSPTHDTTSSVNLQSKKQFTNSVAIEARRKQASDSNHLDFSLGGGAVQDYSGTQTAWRFTTKSNGYYWSGYAGGTNANNIIAKTIADSAATSLISNFDLGTFSNYQRFQYIYDSAGGLWWHLDDTYKISTTDTTYLSNSKNILLTQGEYTNGAGDIQSVDWVFVRKIAGTPTVSEPSVGSFGTAEQSEAPVAFWKFDEGTGSGVFDETSNNNDGTVTTSTWKNEDDCKIGKCLSFDGTSGYVYANDTSAGTSYSVSLWFNSATADNYSNSKNLISRDTKYQIAVTYTADGAGNCNVTGYKLYSFAGTATKFCSSVLAGNLYGWHHVVLTVTPSYRYLYFDGLRVGSDAGGSSDLARSTALIIGGLDNTDDAIMNPTSLFNGKIDEVKVYPYARTAAQIKKDYESGRLKNVSTAHGVGVAVGEEPAGTLTDGLVGWWKMDEASWNGTASEVIDSSGVGNNGTAAGAGGITGTTSTAKYGRAGDFDGTDDYVNIANASSLQITSALTLSMWAKYNTAFEGYAVSKGFDRLDFLTYAADSGKMTFYVNGADPSLKTTGAYNDGTWHHFVGIYDPNGGANNLRIYVDGVLNNQGTRGGSPVTDSSPLRIGCYGANASFFWNGAVDDVRLYNRALSGAEVRQLYNSAPPPIAQWKFDEGTGQYAFDNSGHSATGTLGASASASTDDPTWAKASQCKYGGCLSFDGNNSDYVSIPSTNISALGSTISLWFKASVIGNIMISKAGTNNTYIYQQNATTIVVQTDVGSTAKSYTVPTMSTNTWYHVAVTRNNNTTRVYLNGIESSTGGQTQTDTMIINQIGKYGVVATLWWNGSLDDVRIYNYARTPTQIREDMLAGAPVYSSPRVSVAPNAPNDAASGPGGMVGYWKFDEGATSTYAYDATSNNNDGTYYGSVSSTPGKFGRAAEFDGASGYIDTKDIDAIDGTSALTVSAWIKEDSLVVDKAIVVKWDYQTQGTFGFQTGASTAGAGKLSVYMATSLTDDGNGCRVDTTNVVLQAGVWKYIAMVFDGSQTGDRNRLKIYVDGVVVATTQGAGSVPASLTTGGTATVKISEFGGILHRYFNGKIDEVKIYNTALTADEIKADYNKGKAMMLGGASSEDSVAASGSGDRPAQSSATGQLVGWWKMDDKIAQYARDASGYGNDGTLGANTGSSTDDPTWKSSAYCHSGSCLSFDGSTDYATVSSKDSLEISSAITVSAWIKQAANNANNGILYKGGFAGAHGDYQMNVVNGVVQFTVGVYSHGIQTSSAVLSVGRWYYIVATADSSAMRIYIDGVPQSTSCFVGTCTPGSISTSNTNLIIGGYFSSSFLFQGSIDDAKIWNYALSQAEIAYEYNRGRPVAHWKFDEGQGDYAYDASGNSNYGYVIIGTGGTQTTTSSAWTAGTTGKINGAMSFDGTDDNVQVSHSALWNSTDMSASMWVKLNSDKDSMFLQHQSGAAAGGFEFDYQVATHILVLSPNGAQIGVSKSWTPVVGRWYHIMFTRNATTDVNTLYVDGVSIGSNTETTDIGSVTGVLDIGNGTYSGYEFSGLIDDVRIYNYPLSASQIKEVYNNAKAVYFK